MPLLRALWIAVLCLACLVSAAEEKTPLRIGTTPVFLDDQIGFLDQWAAYLGLRLNQPVRFVQRASYRQIVRELMEGNIDFAWICGYPFVREEERLRLVAVPVWQGEPRYRSYLIVPREDTVTQSLRDLEGRIFAYSDPPLQLRLALPPDPTESHGGGPATLFRADLLYLVPPQGGRGRSLGVCRRGCSRWLCV